MDAASCGVDGAAHLLEPAARHGARSSGLWRASRERAPRRARVPTPRSCFTTFDEERDFRD